MAEARVDFAWLEITSKCQLECMHCYAESGPQGTHGSLSTGQWMDVIDQLVGVGVQSVQFIGGEPTLHPGFRKLLLHALDRRLEVEVYTNLVKVPESLWDVLTHPRVSLATSYYSSNPKAHNAVTMRSSHARTRANIGRALSLKIPLRVGIVSIRNEQRVEEARDELRGLGVSDVGVDRWRGVGRGSRDHKPRYGELCGHCTGPVLAVLPDGDVQPCVFARWREATIGNVADLPVDQLVVNGAVSRVRGMLREEFAEASPYCGPGCRPNCLPSCPPSAGPPIPCFPDKKPPTPPTPPDKDIDIGIGFSRAIAPTPGSGDSSDRRG
jgi:MoaA/NifB/PqqE/SkfB family radical SAM enzyme